MKPATSTTPIMAGGLKNKSESFCCWLVGNRIDPGTSNSNWCINFTPSPPFSLLSSRLPPIYLFSWDNCQESRMNLSGILRDRWIALQFLLLPSFLFFFLFVFPPVRFSSSDSLKWNRENQAVLNRSHRSRPNRKKTATKPLRPEAEMNQIRSLVLTRLFPVIILVIIDCIIITISVVVFDS